MKTPCNQTPEKAIVDQAVMLLVRKDDRGLEILWSQHHETLRRYGYAGPVQEARRRLAAPRNAERQRLLPKVHALATRMMAAAKTGNEGGMRAARNELRYFQPSWAVTLYCTIQKKNLDDLCDEARRCIMSVRATQSQATPRRRPVRQRQLAA